MKKCVRHGDPQRQSHWEEVVRRWREGGQSVRAFCRAEGLRESAFYSWRRKLGRCRSRADAVNGPRSQPHLVTPASRLSKQVSPRHSPSASFLPLHVVAPVNGCADLAEATHGVEIVLSQGHTVRVPAGFDRQTLADVLAVLEVRPC